jgi:glycosyltransferase involved in cell wall biosynthesis
LTVDTARTVESQGAITVLHLVDNFSVGGTPIKAIRFASSSPRNLIRPLLGAFNEDGLLAGEAQRLGLNPYSFDGDDTQLAKFLRQEAVDHLIVHSGFPGVFKAVSAARRVGVNHIFRTNEFGWVDKVDSQGLADKNLFISRFALERFKRLSNLTWDRVIQKSFITWMPVDTALFHPVMDKRVPSRISSELTEGTFLLGRVGRPDPSKLDSFLIRSLELLRDVRKDWTFLVVGGLPPYLAAAVRKHGLDDHVRVVNGPLLPFEIARIVSSLHLYCHTARVGETFGLAIAEAMATGLPVVSQQTPYSDDGVCEVVAEGRNGFLELTPRGLVESVCVLMDDPDKRRRFGEESRAIVERRFDIGVLGKRFHAITLAENCRDPLSTLSTLGLAGPLADAQREVRETPQYWRQYLNARHRKWAALLPSERLRIRGSLAHTYCLGRRAYFSVRARLANLSFSSTQTHSSRARHLLHN